MQFIRQNVSIRAQHFDQSLNKKYRSIHKSSSLWYVTGHISSLDTIVGIPILSLCLNTNSQSVYGHTFWYVTLQDTT